MTAQFKQIITHTVTDLSSRGDGVVKVDHFPYFVPGALPGEEITFGVTDTRKNYGNGELIKIETASPHRVEPTDPTGYIIGTMPLQHLAYNEQLNYKQNQVQQAFQRIGHLPDVDVKPTLGMENPWGYRNKAQVPARMIDGELMTGFYRRGSHDLVPVDDFHIQIPAMDAATIQIRAILNQSRIPAYNEEEHTGLIRHIITRYGEHTDELMVIIVINSQTLPQKLKPVLDQIVAQVPGLVSLAVNYQPKKTNVILSPQTDIYWGQSYYTDRLLDLEFQISPNSFFQVNTSQAEVLYQEALKAAQLTGQEVVVDAYCGIGSISLALAQQAKEVYAMEIVPPAIEMARQNAQLNELDNVHFEVGKAEEWLPRWNEQDLSFDVIVVDPPRKGLDRKFIDAALAQAPERIVYVSCNPATCARDCALFVEGGYQVEYVQPVDMFPQTSHVECVVLLEKIK